MLALILFLVVIACILIYLIKGGAPTDSPTKAVVDQRQLRSVEQAIGDGKDEGWLYAIVFLDTDQGLSIESVRRFLCKQWPEHQGLDSIDSIGMRRQFSTNQGSFSFELVAPYRCRELLTDACRNHYYWPEVDVGIKKHRLAVLVGAKSVGERIDGGPIDYSIALSQAVGALVSTCRHASGALWMLGNLVISRKNLLQRFICDYEVSIPAGLWVACHTYRDSDNRVIGYTQGLAAFGCVEFEAIDAPESEQELRDRLEGLVSYSIFNCEKILSGDTVGVDEFEQIQLARKPSELGRKGWVFQMSYLKQSPSSPWE